MDSLLSQMRAAMDAQGIGVTELARRAGLSNHRNFSMILSGKQRPSDETIQLLADTLGAPLTVPPTPARTFEPRPRASKSV